MPAAQAGHETEAEPPVGNEEVPVQRTAVEVSEVSECAVPSLPVDGQVREAPDLVYARPGGFPLHLDLATPVGPGPHPVVLLIHGGGWRAGERAHLANEARILAGAGLASATVDYRLAPEHTFPKAVSDVRCAVRWLRQHAEDYALDPDRIAAVGLSAGGHLAALLSTAAGADGLDDGCDELHVSPEIQGAVAYFGVFDLRHEAGFHPATERIVAHFLGARPQDDPGLAARASPLTYVDGTEAPFLLVHGDADRTVPIGQSERMVAALTNSGVSAALITLPGAGHGFGLLSRRPRHRRATCTTMAFLQQIFARQ